ncbi:MAG: hypothetical protein GEV28_03765 [Actinophytocola sp.]|uniref:hypothetical protein n=1 Tax=Actinophytocola sp. TaxID=1872138 RepID=UPI00132A541F|nr:hypothetical protein [Actinophytocola sp.]MPZ79549.1 hypothetical protein [Actinophytocola sp.]
MPPEWVGRLRDAGWTKDRVRARLWERARVPLDRLAPGIAGRVAPRAAEEGVLPAALAPEDITIMVAGGPGTKATLLPTWSSSRSVTVPAS